MANDRDPNRNPPIDVPAIDLKTGLWTPDWYDRLKFLDGLDPLSSIDFDPINAAIALRSTIKRTINPQAGNYTFAASDEGNVVAFTGSSAQAITIPANADVPFDQWAQIDLIRLGAGKPTLAGASLVGGGNVNIFSVNSNKAINPQYGGAALLQFAVDNWLLFGSLSS